MLELKTNYIYIICFYFFAVSASRAEIQGFPSFTLSTREIALLEGKPHVRNAFYPYHLSLRLSESRDTFCGQFGKGCLLLAFPNFDDYFFGPRGVIDFDGQIYLTPKNRKHAGPGDFGTLSKVLMENNYYDINKKVKQDRLAIWNAWNEINTIGSQTEAHKAFSDLVLKRSRGVEALPEIYRLHPPVNEVLGELLDQTMADVLWLYLDALYASADYRYSTYLYPDEIVEQSQMVQIAGVYSSLKSQDRWPALRNLGVRLRGKLGPRYTKEVADKRKVKTRKKTLEKDQEERRPRYEVKGFYSQSKNAIYIDFSQPFFENVYNIAHELTHTIVAHTPIYQEKVQNIQDLLTGPLDEKLKVAHLRELIFDFISRSELTAINQLVLLYHAVGHSTRQWATEQISARGWHDSYIYGFTSTPNLSVKEQRFFNGQFVDEHGVLGGLISIPFDLFVLFKHFAWGSVKDRLRNAVDWNVREQRHVTFFEMKYLPYLGSGTHLRTRSLLSLDLKGKVVLPSELTLTCSDLRILKAAVDKVWDLGIPFAYRVAEKCSSNDLSRVNSYSLGGDGTHIGGDGTHIGGDGTHIGIDGFPSLDGEGIFQ